MNRLLFLIDPYALEGNRFAETFGTVSNFIFHFRKSLADGSLLRVACPSLRSSEEIQAIPKTVFSNVKDASALLKLIGNPTHESSLFSAEEMVESFRLAFRWRPSVTSDTPKKVSADMYELETLHIVFIGRSLVSEVSFNWNDAIMQKFKSVVQGKKENMRLYYIDSCKTNSLRSQIDCLEKLHSIGVVFLPCSILASDHIGDFETAAGELIDVLKCSETQKIEMKNWHGHDNTHFEIVSGSSDVVSSLEFVKEKLLSRLNVGECRGIFYSHLTDDNISLHVKITDDEFTLTHFDQNLFVLNSYVDTPQEALDKIFEIPHVMTLDKISAANNEISLNDKAELKVNQADLNEPNLVDDNDKADQAHSDNVVDFYRNALYGKTSVDAFVAAFAEFKNKLKANDRDRYMVDLCADIILNVLIDPKLVKRKWIIDLASLTELIVSTPAYRLSDSLNIPEKWLDSASDLTAWSRWLASGVRSENVTIKTKTLASYVSSEMMCRELQLQLVLVLEVIRIVKYLSKSKITLLMDKLSSRFTESKKMKNYILSLSDDIVDTLAVKFALQTSKEAADALADVKYDGNSFYLRERDLVEKILESQRYKTTIDRICKKLIKKFAVNFFSPPKAKPRQTRPKVIQRPRYSSQPPTSDSASQGQANRQSLIEKISSTAPLIQLPQSSQLSQQSRRSNPYSQSQPKIACADEVHIVKKSTSSSSFLPANLTPRIPDENPFDTPYSATPVKLGHHVLSGTPSRSIISSKRSFLVMDTPAVERNRQAMGQLTLVTSPLALSSTKSRRRLEHDDDDVVMVPATPTPRAKKKRHMK